MHHKTSEILDKEGILLSYRCFRLGEALGARLKEKNINTVVFDRNGYLYHGVVKALADATRSAGIVF